MVFARDKKKTRCLCLHHFNATCMWMGRLRPPSDINSELSQQREASPSGKAASGSAHNQHKPVASEHASLHVCFTLTSLLHLTALSSAPSKVARIFFVARSKSKHPAWFIVECLLCLCSLQGQYV